MIIDNVKVLLTTTEYTIAADTISHMNLMRMSYKPVCIVKLSLDNMPVIPNDMLLRSMLELCGDVIIDYDNKIFRITDRGDNQNYFVDFCALPNITETQNAFFETWKNCRQLLFEFHLIYNNNIKLGLQGYWENNKWELLRIKKDMSINVIAPPLSYN